MINDDQMVAAAQAGDAGALEDLVRRYERPILRFYQRLSGDVERARDLRQELFCKLLRVLPRYDKRKAAFNTWLYRLAHNLAIDQLYRKKQLNVVSLDGPGPEAEHEAPVDLPSREAARGEIQSSLARALTGLSDIDRAIIALKHDDGLTFEEVATTLGLPVSTVKSRLYRAFERLRKEMRTRGHDGDF